MGDLSDINSAQTVKIVGSDSTGTEQTAVQSTSNGSLHSNLRNNAGTEIGTVAVPIQTQNPSEKTNNTTTSTISTLVAGTDGTNQRPLLTDMTGRLVTTSEVLSLFPSFKEFIRIAIASGAIYSEQFVVASDTAIKEFHIGGRTGCEGFLAKYNSAINSLLSGFNSSPQVATWSNTSIGDSAPISWAYNTAQFTEGTGSASHAFPKSDSNNYPEITYTFPTVQDLSGWRYIKASGRVTVAEGGNQTRKLQIRVKSGTAIRVWEISGTTTTSPFSTEQWHTVIGELESPTSIDGTGTFDINKVSSVSLRLIDGGNKAGTVYWDNVQLYGEIDMVEKIYSSAGNTNQLIFDPIVLFETGETLMMSIKNIGAITAEIQAAVSGVSV